MADEMEGAAFTPVEVGDFDEAVEEDNKVLAPGMYQATIMGWKHSYGKTEKKTQYIGWRLETVNCPDPEDNGYTLWYNTPIEGRGKSMLIRFCQALGQRWEGDAFTPDFCDSLIALEVTVETAITTYNNKQRCEIRRAIASGNYS